MILKFFNFPSNSLTLTFKAGKNWNSIQKRCKVKLTDLRTEYVVARGLASLALPLQCRASVGRAAAVRADTDLHSFHTG